MRRGAYLVEVLGHCGECHTPRGWLGARDEERRLAGTVDGPDGEKVPNITPDPDTGIGGWSAQDVIRVLESGLLPDFDAVGGAMGEVVRSTSKLEPADRAAIALGAAERRAADGGAEELAGRLARCRADLRLLRALDDTDTFRWTVADRFPDPNNYNCPAEIAVGLNPKVTPIGSMRTDKKLYGSAHIGMGDTVALGGTCHARLRLEGVIRHPEVTIDGRLVTRGGKILVG